MNPFPFPPRWCKGLYESWVSDEIPISPLIGKCEVCCGTCWREDSLGIDPPLPPPPSPPSSPSTCPWWIKIRAFLHFLLIRSSFQGPPAENWPEDIRGKWNARQWLKGFWMWVKINVKAWIKCTIHTKHTLWCVILEDKVIKKTWLKSEIWCSNPGAGVRGSLLFNPRKKQKTKKTIGYCVMILLSLTR